MISTIKSPQSAILERKNKRSVGTPMKVSVIIPYKNEAIYIDDCLDSLEEQTSKEFEAIVVCDHSSREAMEPEPMPTVKPAAWMIAMRENTTPTAPEALVFSWETK